MKYNYVVIGVIVLVVVGVISTTLIILSAPPGFSDEMIAFRVGLVTAFLGAAITSLLALMQGAANSVQIQATKEQLNGHTQQHVELNTGVVQLAKDAIKAATTNTNYSAEEGMAYEPATVASEDGGKSGSI